MAPKRPRSESPEQPPRTLSHNPTPNAFGSSGLPGPSSLPRMVKQDGRIVATGRQAIPTQVHTGRTRRFPPITSPHSKGLRGNGEVFCYRDAALQALLHAPAFYRYLGKTHRTCRRTADRCVVCALQDLALGYWNDDSQPARQTLLDTFNAACQRNPPTSDSSLAADFGFPIGGIPTRPKQADVRDFTRWLIRAVIRDTEERSDGNAYDETFEVLVTEAWTCDKCGITHESAVKTTEQIGLTLPIQDDKVRDVMTGLRQAFTTTTERRCESDICLGRVRAEDLTAYMKSSGSVVETRRTIVQAPEALIIGIERWAGNLITLPGGRQTVNEGKLMKDLSAPPYLNLNEYCKVGDDVIYRLDAVVGHQGKTARSGHYITAVREPDGFEFRCVDGNVVEKHRGGTMSEMKTIGPKHNVAQSTMLVYSRV